MLKEFKQFAMKGNVMDLAIGVVIGAAFQKIVSSLVEDIIMPCISMITGKIDFSNMMLTVGDVSIKYGNFITAIVNFLIISFSIFLVVRYINKMHQPKKLKEFNEKLKNALIETFINVNLVQTKREAKELISNLEITNLEKNFEIFSNQEIQKLHKQLEKII